jgi:hypothetical protein
VAWLFDLLLDFSKLRLVDAQACSLVTKSYAAYACFCWRD